ncbi:hypothetical protein L7F22_021805 [Adiantum nelumboides]|nr:hypothetical protein [Adiantum nelumboides]
MTGEEMQAVQLDGDVLVVGLKLDNTGRELLTWTLAKFTQAGNRVIALHVASSASEADILRKQIETTEQPAEGCFDSILGVYESFCSIKQAKLQVKVSNGGSLRRTLVEECKKINAVKLILGHASSKPHIGPSFSLAKYCSRRLPPTCSVVVIQQGQVAFEKEGSLRNLGENTAGVLHTIQKTLRTHSWKNSGHHLTDVRRASVYSSKSLETETVYDEYGNATCPWPLPSRFLDSPVSVLHAYKHPSFQKRLMGPVESPLSALSSPTTLTSDEDAQNNQEKVLHSHQSLEQCFAIAEKYYDQLGQCSGALMNLTSAQPIRDISLQRSEEKDVKSCTLYQSIDTSTNGSCLLAEDAAEDDSPHVGWPLLRKHFATDHVCKSSSRRLSVVEWALQLPDRPKHTMNQQAELLKYETDGHNSSPHLSGEKLNHEQQTKQDGSNVCEVDALLPQHYNDALESRIARLSNARPCKQFQLKELQDATNNFNSDNMVGRGGCSQVYRGVISEDHTVAVKCMNASGVDSEDDLATEVEIMCSLDHIRIVQLIGYCLDNQRQMLVYNFAPQGNLEQTLHGAKGKAVLAWEPRYSIAVGVAEALNYLHDCCKRPVIHRDVKSSNILLSADLEPQLTDFGLAKWMPASSTQITCSDVVGTFGYLAPEYFMFGKVSEKTDVYSFGVVLLELITGRRPIDNTRPKGEENLVVWARQLLEDESSAEKLIDPKLERSYDYGQLKNMILAAVLCLRQSSQTRPRMSRILKLLRGEVEDLDHIGRQESVCKESDDGCDMPNYGEIDIRTHLTLALLGLDDDAVSQASIEHSVNLAHSNKYLEEYLGGRYSRSSSFE